MRHDTLTRREFLAATIAAAALAPFASPGAPPAKNSFRIGACDWSLGKTADVAAL